MMTDHCSRYYFLCSWNHFTFTRGSAAGVSRQINTCFTAHSSGAGVIHQIQTCFTAHTSAAGVSWHKLHCSQQCGRCQSADLSTLRCQLKTLLQMAPHSCSLFGFELLGCDDLFGGNLEHLFCSVSFAHAKRPSKNKTVHVWLLHMRSVSK